MSLNITKHLLQDIKHELSNSDIRICNWNHIDKHLGIAIHYIEKEMILDREEATKRENRLQNEG